MVIYCKKFQVSFLCYGCGNPYSRLSHVGSWFVITCHFEEPQ